MGVVMLVQITRHFMVLPIINYNIIFIKGEKVVVGFFFGGRGVDCPLMHFALFPSGLSF